MILCPLKVIYLQLVNFIVLILLHHGFHMKSNLSESFYFNPGKAL